MSAMTKDEARVALGLAAWPTTSSYTNKGRHWTEDRALVHCFLGGMGADWDLEGALDLVDRSKGLGWTDHWMGHDLVVVDCEGRVYCFDVPRPS